ncbi:MAG: DUF6177 family protein [Beutenbergiaceae bacterium]
MKGRPRGRVAGLQKFEGGLPATSYPGIDEVSDGFILHTVESRHVALSPSLAQVIFEAAADQRGLVLITHDDAELSPFMVAEMRRFGHRWVYRHADGMLVDANSGFTVHNWGDLLLPPAPDAVSLLPPAKPGQSRAAINLEVVGQHRVSPTLLLGAMAEAFAETGPRTHLDAMGMREPLHEWWSREELTERVRRQMPKADIVRACSSDGVFVDLAYERSKHGLIERMRGRLVLGEWRDWAPRAVPIAEDLLARLADLCVPVVMTTSLIDVDVLGEQGIRRREPEVPLAWMGGPSIVYRTSADVDALASRFNGSRLGRRAVPSLLVTFPPSAGDPREQLNRLLAEVAIHATASGETS